MENTCKIDKATKLLELLNYEFAMLTGWFCYRSAIGWSSIIVCPPVYCPSNFLSGTGYYSGQIIWSNSETCFMAVLGITAVVLMVLAGVCAALKKFQLVIFLDFVCSFIFPPCGLLLVLASILAIHQGYVVMFCVCSQGVFYTSICRMTRKFL